MERCSKRRLAATLEHVRSRSALRRRDAAAADATRSAGSADAATVVDDATVRAYQTHGAVLIKNLLTAPQLARLREGIDDNLANPGAFGAVASPDSDPGEFFEDFCNWQRIPAFQDIIFGTAIPRVAARLMGSRTVRLFHDHLCVARHAITCASLAAPPLRRWLTGCAPPFSRRRLVKEARTVQPTPYHQDQPYYNIEGTQNVSFWLPVDPVPAESSLCFVAGSHAKGECTSRRPSLPRARNGFLRARSSLSLTLTAARAMARGERSLISCSGR